MSHSQEYLQRGHARARTARIVFVILCVAVVFWILTIVVGATQVFAHMLDARDDLLVASGEASAFLFDSATVSLEQAETSFVAAERFLPVLGSVSWLPVLGSKVESLRDVIRSGHDVVKTLQPLFDLGSDLVQLSGLSTEYLAKMQEGLVPTVTFGDLSTETKRAILQRLSASADDLDLLSAQIEIVQAELTLITQDTQIGPLLSLVDPLRIELQEVGSELKLVGVLARLLPSFAGLDKDATTLLLFLNNNELRPSGGFIGSYGVLKMSGGEISELETADVYALDDAAQKQITRTAPSPLQRYNDTSSWFFRDSNWSPDFAVSSMAAIELFLEEVGFLEDSSLIPMTTQVDNVIGFTPTYASNLLKITGPIIVGGQTFTSENVAETLEYQVEYGYVVKGLPRSQRKEILADLVREMKTRLYALPPESWQEVLEVTRQALQEKQLLLYSTQDDVQGMIASVGWGGSVDSKTVDTLMVVDANLASLKSDPVVEREITYSIKSNASDDWIGEVSIHYKHTGDFDWKTTRYRTYVRVYLPEGTELIDVEGSWLNDIAQNPTGAEGIVDVVHELGLISFGTFTSVEPGGEHTLTFTFELAPEVVLSIDAGDYALSVLKQAGAQNNALTLELDFDKNVTHATPPENEGEWGDALYRLNTILDQDVEVEIQL
ncbi:MAG: DUF4012 domain-containing protein [Patescibacteria group bacterium]